MELSLQIPLLLFPAVSLLYLSYNGRFLALAQLIRSLHKEYETDGRASTREQIASLRQRLRFIVYMQIFGALSFIAAAVSSTCLFFGANIIGYATFGVALIFLIASVIILLLEIRVSMYALSILIDKSAPPASNEP
ncbi:MAG: DUF2721 domain-containing protein [Deltaproteobacteria bacterium]|nr:DUF2721 domain-containing protein [Deltaproteobacteria bacterium]